MKLTLSESELIALIALTTSWVFGADGYRPVTIETQSNTEYTITFEKTLDTPEEEEE